MGVGSVQTCDRCDARLPSSSYELMDYCAACLKNLCAACMAKGCCGHVPAVSGMKADFEDELAGTECDQSDHEREIPNGDNQ
jgi:hypothetical protein